MNRQDLINFLKEKDKKAHPAPWSGSANYPFYACIDKPRPSLSKHDQERPQYMMIEDVDLLLFLRNNVSHIIKFLEEKAT